MILLCGLGPLAAAKPSGESLKRVLILPLRDKDDLPSQAYLGGSITDVIRDSLKAKYAFNETSEQALSAYVKQNYFDENDYAATSVAYHLGFQMKQDIVINGFFQVTHGKDGDQIHITARIFDINSRKLAKEVKMTGPASNAMFKTLDQLAIRIVEESKQLFGDRKEWEAKGYIFDDRLTQQVSFGGGITTFALPKSYAGAIGSNATLLPGDIPHTAVGSLRYERIDFLLRNLYPFAQAQFYYGKASFQTNLNFFETPASLVAGSLQLGLGYKISLSRLFSLTPFAGGGWYYGVLTYDFSRNAGAATSSTGAALTETRVTMSTPTAVLGAALGYDITRSVFLRLSAQAEAVFFKSQQSYALVSVLNVGVRF